jgi:RHS repeat-associated protein
MKLSSSQVDALAAATMDRVRTERLFELREQGFEVQEGAKTGEILVRDKAGGVARVESLGLRTRVTSTEGATTEFEQHHSGRVSRIVDPAGREVRFERDSAGYLQAIDRGPGGGRFGFELSKDWKPLRIEYPDGTISRAEYTSEGSPARITNRDGTEIRYEYTPAGSLAAIVDPRGGRTQFSYPGPGVSRSVEYPDGNRHEYVDNRENGLQRLLVNGDLHAEYRSSGDAVEVEYRDGSRERFTFDNGRLLEAANEHATVKFTYDGEGRLLSEEVDGQVVQYQRNAVGALIGIVTPQGETLTYVRDRDQRLTGVVDWEGGHYRIGLPASGPATEVSYPNGVRVTTTASPMGLPASWSVLGPGSGAIDGATWDYDTCDRLISAARLDIRREYRYDRASRLASVRCSESGFNERFFPDSCGNRTDESQYDPANRLLRHGGRKFAYDALGNLVSDVGGAAPRRYRYNGRGQLVGVEQPGRSIEYRYDPLGRRIAKKVDGVTTRFQWAGTQLLSETVDDGKRTVRRDYLFCPEFLTPLAFREGTSVFSIHSGRLQEPLCVTDAVGIVVWQADYLAFGKARILADRVALPFRLPGQYFDEETGLHYSVARYYDADLGRFLSLDPARRPGGSCNYYLYCDGDPVNRIDPTGEISLTLATVLTAVAVGAVVGAAIGAGVELYKQRNQEHTDWGEVGKAAALGGLLGAVGGLVGVVAEAALVGAVGLVAAGAAAGALGAAAEYCVQAAITDQWSWGQFGTSVAAGAAIGAVTAGIGGIIAGRAARRAAQEAERKAAEEAAKRAAREAEERAAKEAAERAAKEAEERAAREAEERAAREAAEKKARLEEFQRQRAAQQKQQALEKGIKDAEANGKLDNLSQADRDFLNSDPRAKELAYDPDTKSFKPDEARAALAAEKNGTLKSPVTRDIDASGRGGGGDFVDGDGKVWDVKDASAGADHVAEVASPKGGQPGENVLVDTSGMSPADAAAFKQDVASKLPPGSGDVRYVP